MTAVRDEALLFLAHRLPYPPNKGDKVRSYHFLRALSRTYRVYLGTFVDDAADWGHLPALRAICAELHVAAIRPVQQRVRSAAIGFARGESLSAPYFRNAGLAEWVRGVVKREGICRAFCYSSPMFQYVRDLRVHTIADFVDVDSAKWDEYAKARAWPFSAIYRREGAQLLRFERSVADDAHAVVFVTEQEAQLFRERVPHCAARIVTVHNGVNGEFFSPDQHFDSPFAPTEQAVVFTGAMDYWPNVEAVCWFAQDVLPRIRRAAPGVRFHVVGMNPAPAVRALSTGSDVVVTGRVPDVRPYLQHARVVVAPLRIARGVQNKVLEAMAMAKPVVCTSAAAAGLNARPGEHFEVADDAAAFAMRVLDLMRAPGSGLGDRARSHIVEQYSWAKSAQCVASLLDAGPSGAPDAEREGSSEPNLRRVALT
jgi:sugar transferase (PEP-CTERM/EpsH1 system associated)